MKRRKPIHAPIQTPIYSRVRKPMPAKPPKVEIPKTVYRRRPKHGRPAETDR